VIDFKTSLEEGSVLGFCLGDKNRADIEIARTIHGEKLSFMEQMNTIAHEMVHAKQYFRGELMHGDGGDFKWKKRNAGGYKYENQPWEKEAFRREGELLAECFPYDMI
jgi:predicted SprT family Zn-dependent metalloprotease